MKVLIEAAQDVSVSVEELNEGANPVKNYYLTGTFMQAETVNRNGRIYPKAILEKELGRYNGMIQNKRSVGELGHPNSPSINLDRISHLITNLHMEGNIIVGKAKILDTPCGNIAKKLIDEGIILGMSSRGLGSLKQVNNTNLVQDDYKLATVDIVHEPSAPDALVQSIFESKEWLLVDGVIREVDLENTRRQMLKSNSKDVNRLALHIFERLLAKF
jgi:hypothetical protein